MTSQKVAVINHLMDPDQQPLTQVPDIEEGEAELKLVLVGGTRDLCIRLWMLMHVMWLAIVVEVVWRDMMSP
jgi:hypothetical protein